MPTPLTARALSAPTRHHRPSRRAAAGAALVVAVGLLLGACGGSGDAPAKAQATDAPTHAAPQPLATNAPPAQDERSEAEAAYLSYWDTWVLANDPPQPTHPQLERWATGAQLARTVDAIRDRLEQGLVMRRAASGGYQHVVTEVTVEGDSATIVDCALDDAVIASRSDGRVLNDSVTTRLLRSSMVRTAEGWKLADVVTVRTWEGDQPCAL